MLKNDAERWSADPVSLAGIAFHRVRTQLAGARQQTAKHSGRQGECADCR